MLPSPPPPSLTFNQFVAPLLGLMVAALVLLFVLVTVRREARKQAQLARLAGLKPPARHRNHRSVPVRQYYLTQQMAKPTDDDLLLLRKWRTLHPEDKEQ